MPSEVDTDELLQSQTVDRVVLSRSVLVRLRIAPVVVGCVGLVAEAALPIADALRLVLPSEVFDRLVLVTRVALHDSKSMRSFESAPTYRGSAQIGGRIE